MRRRLAELTMRLYPIAFRRRYGEEMEALIEDREPGMRDVLDMLRAALTAHLRPPEGLQLGAQTRLKASTGGVLACWAVFAVAGFAFYNSTEDHAFRSAGASHALLGWGYSAIQALAIVASLAVLAGAAPLILSAVGHARRRPRLRAIVSVPPAAAIAFAGLTGLLALLAHAHLGESTGHVAFALWSLAGLACAAACVIGARIALFATPTSGRRLLFALACATVVTVAMAAITLLTLLYAIALQIDAPRLAASPNGPFGLASTNASIAAQMIGMALAGAAASTATRRGWRSLPSAS